MPEAQKYKLDGGRMSPSAHSTLLFLEQEWNKAEFFGVLNYFSESWVYFSKSFETKKDKTPKPGQLKTK